MMIRLIEPDLADDLNQPRRSCHMCGTEFKRVELPFDSGSTEPTVGETLTGATSGDTGVVVSTKVYDGTWAGGDAEGYVALSTFTGDDFDTGTIYQDNETITGSTGGANMMTVDGQGAVTKYGRFYRESQLVRREGRYYCTPHYTWRFRNKDYDDIKLDLDENYRGPEW
jgi:hypothetical protein